NAGNPTVFVTAASLGFKGTEMQSDINENPALLAKLEKGRAQGAVAMKLAKNLDEAAQRQHTPKISFVAAPADYVASDGRKVGAESIDPRARIVSTRRV